MMKSKGKGKMKDRTRMVRVNNPQYMDNTDAGSYLNINRAYAREIKTNFVLKLILWSVLLHFHVN